MTTIDTLQILVEADASQIEGVLKRALTTVTGAVSSMNKQEVDWTSIFTRAVSPALIAGVASTFAIALEQFTAFNTAAINLNNTATPATAEFASGIGKASGDIYNMASSAGRGLGDTADAYYAFTKAGLDNAAAQYAVVKASGIAYDTQTDLKVVTNELSNLFEKWGVTTTPQVTEALTGLTNSLGKGKFSFGEMVDTIASEGSALSGKAHIGDLSIDLQTLSNTTKLTKTAVIEEFHAIAGGVAKPISDINFLVTDMGTAISSGPDGLITAFSAINTKIHEWGPSVAGELGPKIGISVKTVSDNTKTMHTQFKESATQASALRDALIPLNDLLKNNEPLSAKVAANFERLKVALAQMVLPHLGDWLKTASDGFAGLQTVMKGTNDWLKEVGVTDAVKALYEADKKGVETLLGTFVGAPTEAAYNALSGGTNPIQDTQALETINKKLLGAGATPQAINKIDQTAQSSGLTAQLLHALSSGMSAGGTSNTQLNNTFHLTVPTGSQQFTADMIAKQLYQNFQGSK
jgi:hypothetical protein